MKNRGEYISAIQNAMHINGRIPYSAEIIGDILDAVDLISEKAKKEKKKAILNKAKKRAKEGSTTSVEIIKCGEK